MGDLPVVGLLLAVGIGVSLGFFGGGGSILTVPLLVYVFGLDPKEAIASSLIVVGTTSAVAAVQHARRGNVRMREALVFGAAGMAGAYLGGRGGGLLDGGFLLLLFAAMMVLTSVAMWRRRRDATGAAGAPGAARPVVVPKLVGQGFAVGAFTGLVGAGGGFLIVPALTLWGGLAMAAAVGTSLVVIVMQTSAAFAGYAGHVDVDPTTVAAVTACAVAGSFGGARLAHVVDPAALRKAFAGFVLVMACAILVREGALVARAAAESLPRNLPQIFFALVMLGVGVVAGRASRASSSKPPDLTYQGGGGI
jgi:uncharacterized membrane protein YfcA